jgi:YfiH family protein
VTPTVRLDRSGSLVALRFPSLEAVPGVRHAVTTRIGGASADRYASANLGLSVGDDRQTVLTNRAAAATLVGVEACQPATVRQVHGVASVLVSEPSLPGEPLGAADQLATNRPELPLMVQSADCVPLIVVDPVRSAVAVVHAGWRGTAAHAGREAVAMMQRLFDSRPGDLLVGIGPSIGGCCYEVGEDVAADVAVTVPEAAPAVVTRPNAGRPHVDLAAALAAQLRSAGVGPERIASAGICSACRLDLFYSHRREGEPTGRFGALVALAPER